MLWIAFAIIISYLIGSIPTAYIFGKVLKDIDIRKFGSGNVGATNALRILGKKAGFVVLFIDILKGACCVIFIGDIVLAHAHISSDLVRVVLGITTVIGHNWTIFLGFKGGKGVATTLGVLAGLSFRIPGFAMVLLFIILVWLVVFILFRFVSFASMVTAIALPVLVITGKQSRTLVIFSLILSVFILFRHKANLRRLLKGEESKLRFGRSKEN